jgi:hypothetical protein
MTSPLYVQRNGEGVIVGIYARPQPGYAQEAIAADHADVVASRTPPAVPAFVTIRQAKLALLDAELLSTVQTWIDEQADEATRIYWTESTIFERNHPLIEQVATALNLTSEQVDALFVAAAQIP